jgi:hypothetical protein
VIAELLMAKKKKNGPEEEPGGKYTEPVKLTKLFKKKLQRVADSEDLYMGELIEQKLKQYVDSAWLAIHKEDREKEDAEAKAIEERLRKKG